MLDPLGVSRYVSLLDPLEMLCRVESLRLASLGLELLEDGYSRGLLGGGRWVDRGGGIDMRCGDC